MKKMNLSKILSALFLLNLFSIVPSAWTEGLYDIVTLGNRQFRMGNYSSAEKNYLKALDVNKDSMELNFNYGCVLYKREQYDYALKHFHKAFEKADFNTRGKIFFNVGNTYFKLGQIGKASDMYKEALKLNPVYEDARHNLALCIKKQKENPEPEERLTFDETPNPETDEGSFINSVSEREDQLKGEKLEQSKQDIVSQAGGVPEHLGSFASQYKEMSRGDMEKLLKDVAKTDLDVLKEFWRAKINPAGGQTSKGW